MIQDSRFSEWNNVLKQLHHFTGKHISTRTSFEQEILLPFLHKRDYMLTSTQLPNIAVHKFSSFFVQESSNPTEKLGTLIVEYQEDGEQFAVAQMYFV